MSTATKRTPLIQWVMLMFVLLAGGFLCWAGWQSGKFSDYSPAIMADFALAGMIVRSIFKNTELEDDDGYGK